eukprot:8361133-Pyramimonas_sp.AAC.1
MPTHHLAQVNREWHAWKPADHKPEEESRQNDGNYDDKHADEVDPTGAARDDGEPIDSGITDVTCDADTPVDPECVLSPGRRIACRVQSIGWITTH